MITAIDTNILLDILLPNPPFADSSFTSLAAAGAAGPTVVCEIVYAELCAAFTRREDCDAFLEDARIRVEPLSRQAGFVASRAWIAYRRDGGKRDRILPDFLIGAHAELHASRLLTRDIQFYRSRFPNSQITESIVHT